MSREFFFSRKPLTQQVEVGESSVYVRKLSAAEVEKLIKDFGDEKASQGMRWVVFKGTVNEDGSRVFEDADLKKLEEAEFDVIKTIADAVMNFSGIETKESAGD